MKFSEAIAHMENGGECVCDTRRYRIMEGYLEYFINEKWSTDFAAHHIFSRMDWQKAPTKVRTEQKRPRKVIQVCPVQNTNQTQGMLVALCDDSTLWIYGGTWSRLVDVPEFDEEDGE